MNSPHQFDRPIVTAMDVAAGNPVLQALARFPGGSVTGSIILTSVIMVLRAIPPALTGHLHTREGVVGFFQDPAMPLNLVGVAGVWAFAAWSSRAVAELFQHLFSNGVVGSVSFPALTTDGRHVSGADWCKILASAFRSRTRFAISVVVGSAAAGGLALPTYLERWRDPGAWSMADGISVGLSCVWATYGIIGATYFLLTCLQTALWTKRLFRDFRIRVRPLHPDGVGGLAPVSKFSLGITYAFVLLGALLVATMVTRQYLINGSIALIITPDLAIAIGAYLIAAPTAFFSFAAIPHRAMSVAKSRMIVKIERFITEAELDAHDVIEKEGTIQPEHVNTLGNAYTLDRIAHRFPVWPFNLTIIARFVTTYFIPLALGVLVEVAGIFF